jgi:lipoprotein NlpD
MVAVIGLGGCASTLVDYSVPGVHVVQPGETLYAIAWRHGLDYHELARWNGLDNPDLLMVGQRLRLSPGAPAPAPAPAARPAPEQTVSRPPTPAPSTVRWSWPTRGTLIRRFGDRSGLSNGIGIGGTAGQEIRAAAAGRVVYAGSGLAAYGQLVIINHDDRFLSAYGYNERLFVAQGDEVSAGQAIARMGLGPERRAQLHFEIRRNGSPVDPLAYLPGG